MKTKKNLRSSADLRVQDRKQKIKKRVLEH
jgi:hypothetical protein